MYLDKNNQTICLILLDPSIYRRPWSWYNDPYEALAHEMIHAEQFMTGKLNYEDDEILWMGKPYPKWIPYWFRAWERDARSRGNKLAKKFKEKYKL